MLNFSKLFTLDYWFFASTTPFYWVIPILLVFASLIVISIILKIVIKKKLVKDKMWKKLLKKLPFPFNVFGILGLILTFFRYEGVKYLGMRFLFLILFLSFVAWLGFKIFEFKVVYPRIECNYEEKLQTDKYKPVSKKKSKKKNR